MSNSETSSLAKALSPSGPSIKFSIDPLSSSTRVKSIAVKHCGDFGGGGGAGEGGPVDGGDDGSKLAHAMHFLLHS